MADDEGRARRFRAQGKYAEALTARMADLDPALPAYADGFIFGDVWGRPGMAFEERMLVAIIALAATRSSEQLRNYLHGALQDGMSARKVHEGLLMLTVYTGFPTALGALVVWREVVASARRQGLPVDLDE